MAVNLSEQTSFPDLKGWEDSLQMIQSATDAIKDLKNYITKQNEEHQTEKEKQEFRARAEKERTEIKRSETDLIKLKNEFECLHNG